jgi:hypothetical protein
MTYLSAEALTTPHLGEEDVKLDSGGKVRVRALSRAEAHIVSAITKRNTAEGEATILRIGVVNPTLTKDQAKEWMKAGPSGESEKVVRRISRLSGMEERQDTDRYKSDGSGSGD